MEGLEQAPSSGSLRRRLIQCKPRGDLTCFGEGDNGSAKRDGCMGRLEALNQSQDDRYLQATPAQVTGPNRRP